MVGYEKPPNILFIISDDQSWTHAGAYGNQVVKTPEFDSLAKNGDNTTQRIMCIRPLIDCITKQNVEV